MLFATVNKGNAKFNDVAQYLPKIIPQAKAAGFALHETAGAWAYLTAQGMTARTKTNPNLFYLEGEANGAPDPPDNADTSARGPPAENPSDAQVPAAVLTKN